jgi:hypothetical protein
VATGLLAAALAFANPVDAVATTTIAFSDVSIVRTTTGLEISAHVTDPSPVSTVSAVITLDTGGPRTPVTVPLSLQSGTSTDGVWQTSGPLGLADGPYFFQVTPPPAEAEGFSLTLVGVATDQPGP